VDKSDRRPTLHIRLLKFDASKKIQSAGNLSQNPQNAVIATYTVSQKTPPPFYFENNSTKNQQSTIIFGAQHH